MLRAVYKEHVLSFFNHLYNIVLDFTVQGSEKSKIPKFLYFMFTAHTVEAFTSAV